MIRQRRIVALSVLALVVAAITFLSRRRGSGEPARAGGGDQTKAKPQPPPELPRGGRTLFPRHRIVAFYGAPQNVELGALGIGTPDQAGQEAAAADARRTGAAGGSCCRRWS